MLGWSYPEVQTATWMSYDTRIQNILQKTLKKPIVETLKKMMQSNRLFNRDPSAVHLMTTFLKMKENGKTSLQMSTVIHYDLEHHVSKFVGKLVRHENIHDRDGAIHWRLKRQKLKFTFKKGGKTFTDRDWINHIWKGSSRTRCQFCQTS